MRVNVDLYRCLLHFRDSFTFSTVKTDPVRYAVVFATAGSHDPSFKRSTQASTWLIGLASPSRPDLVPTVTMGSACSQHQKWFPGSRPVWRCFSSPRGLTGSFALMTVLVLSSATHLSRSTAKGKFDGAYIEARYEWPCALHNIPDGAFLGFGLRRSLSECEHLELRQKKDRSVCLNSRSRNARVFCAATVSP